MFKSVKYAYEKNEKHSLRRITAIQSARIYRGRFEALLFAVQNAVCGLGPHKLRFRMRFAFLGTFYCAEYVLGYYLATVVSNLNENHNGRHGNTSHSSCTGILSFHFSYQTLIRVVYFSKHLYSEIIQLRCWIFK